MTGEQLPKNLHTLELDGSLMCMWRKVAEAVNVHAHVNERGDCGHKLGFLLENPVVGMR